MEANVLIENSCLNNKKGLFPIDRWMHVGPLKFPNNEVFEHVHDAEKVMNTDESCEGHEGGIFWQSSNLDDDSSINLTRLVSDEVGSVALVSTYIYLREKKDYDFLSSSSGLCQFSVNGELLGGEVPSMPGDLQVRLSFNRGWNRLTIKCVNSVGEKWSFRGCLLVQDKEKLNNVIIKTCFMEGNDTDTQLFGKNHDDECQSIEIGEIDTEYLKSSPDSIVYIPKEGQYNDGDNEHFLVFESPSEDGGLIAIWTQGTMEPSGDNHIVCAHSSDGINWTDPSWVVGTHKGTSEFQASWGFPVIAKETGRIYCFYSKSPAGRLGGVSGILGVMVSDDCGRTWSADSDILFPDCYINDAMSNAEKGGFIVWQKPILDTKGRCLVGYTFFGEDKISSCKFMRFNNINKGMDSKSLDISWLQKDQKGILLPETAGERSCSEPSTVLLPDGRLFTIMRTLTGYIWFSISCDDGENWSEPRILENRSNGDYIKHPLAPCPLYETPDGSFMLIHYDNDYYAQAVKSGKKIPAGMSAFTHRRPACIAIGKYMPNEKQPIWFNKSSFFMDNDGVIVGPKASNEIGTYGSITNYNGRLMYWYPDRKYYLLGKEILWDSFSKNEN